MISSWATLQKKRTQVFMIGKISAVFFILFALSLLDGVQMLVRTDVFEITLLAGESEGISGACPFQNPVQSDLHVAFEENAPLRFTLEGFFAGYLLGNGMWRGWVRADAAAQTGTYSARIFFRGVEQGQAYTIRVFANAKEYQKEARSFVFRFLGFSPFIGAFFLFGIAAFFCSITYFLAKEAGKQLYSLGFAEIFRTKSTDEGITQFWCGAHGSMLRIGDLAYLLNKNGKKIGVAKLVSQKKSILQFETDVKAVTHGCFVSFTAAKIPDSSVEETESVLLQNR